MTLGLGALSGAFGVTSLYVQPIDCNRSQFKSVAKGAWLSVLFPDSSAPQDVFCNRKSGAWHFSQKNSVSELMVMLTISEDELVSVDVDKNPGKNRCTCKFYQGDSTRIQCLQIMYNAQTAIMSFMNAFFDFHTISNFRKMFEYSSIPAQVRCTNQLISDINRYCDIDHKFKELGTQNKHIFRALKALEYADLEHRRRDEKTIHECFRIRCKVFDFLAQQKTKMRALIRDQGMLLGCVKAIIEWHGILASAEHKNGHMISEMIRKNFEVIRKKLTSNAGFGNGGGGGGGPTDADRSGAKWLRLAREINALKAELDVIVAKLERGRRAEDARNGHGTKLCAGLAICLAVLGAIVGIAIIFFTAGAAAPVVAAAGVVGVTAGTAGVSTAGAAGILLSTTVSGLLVGVAIGQVPGLKSETFHNAVNGAHALQQDMKEICLNDGRVQSVMRAFGEQFSSTNAQLLEHDILVLLGSNTIQYFKDELVAMLQKMGDLLRVIHKMQQLMSQQNSWH